MHTDSSLVVAAPGHPSLDGAIDRFGDALRDEVGPALLRRLGAHEPGLRLAAVHDGEIVGLARIDTTVLSGPELLAAVVPGWRGRGVAQGLAEALVGRARDAGLDRIVLRTDARGARLRDLGERLGYRVVDVGDGVLELVRTLVPSAQTA